MSINTNILGKSGIEVTEIGIGLWAAGGDAWGPTDDAEILNLIDAGLDAGVNFYDTADVYGGGHSEQLLGKVMQGHPLTEQELTTIDHITPPGGGRKIWPA